MENILLEANERKEITKPARKKLRKEGRVPGVFYSKRVNTISIDVSERAIHPLVYTTKANLISLKIKGHDDYECVIKDVQFDPVTDQITHFDLLGITRGEKIEIEIPVQLSGSAIGVKEGGLLQQILHKLNVECLPRHIPEFLEIDVSELAIGDSIQARNLNFENVTILNPEDSIVVTVGHPKHKEELEVVEEAVEEEESAEPEVIGKGKAEDQEKEDKKKEEES